MVEAESEKLDKFCPLSKFPTYKKVGNFLFNKSDNFGLIPVIYRPVQAYIKMEEQKLVNKRLKNGIFRRF